MKKILVYLLIIAGTFIAGYHSGLTVARNTDIHLWLAYSTEGVHLQRLNNAGGKPKMIYEDKIEDIYTNTGHSIIIKCGE